MDIELFECAPLAAKISKVQCEKNRARKEDTNRGIWGVKACEGCAGLGNKLESVEVKEMAKVCSVKGCTKMAQGGKNGMCKAHFSGNTPRPVRRDVVASECSDKPLITAAQVKQYSGASSDFITTVGRKDPVTTSAEKSALIDKMCVPIIPAVAATLYEVHVTNLVELFKAKQQAELELLLSTLSSLDSEPLKKLEYALGQVCR
jgi:hypothetical protein